MAGGRKRKIKLIGNDGTTSGSTPTPLGRGSTAAVICFLPLSLRGDHPSIPNFRLPDAASIKPGDE